MDNTQAIREDAKVLRRDAVNIKELTRQEADNLRADIATLRCKKTLAPDLQDFLRLSQDCSNRVADIFVTPAHSDAGLDDALTKGFSRSPLVLTPGSSVTLDEESQAAAQYENAGLICASRGKPMLSNKLPARSQPTKPLPNTSSTREVPRHHSEEEFASSDE